MKPRSSCELCRQRRRKCVVRTGAERCNACAGAGQACRFGSKFRFHDDNDLAPRRHRHPYLQPGQDDPTTPGNVVQASAGPITPSDTATLGDPVGHAVDFEISAQDTPERDESCTLEAFFPSLKTPKAASVTSIAYLLDTPPASSQDSPTVQAGCRPSSELVSAPRHDVWSPIRITAREAYLMRLYVLQLAPSVSSRFRLQVPGVQTLTTPTVRCL